MPLFPSEISVLTPVTRDRMRQIQKLILARLNNMPGLLPQERTALEFFMDVLVADLGRFEHLRIDEKILYSNCLAGLEASWARDISVRRRGELQLAVCYDRMTTDLQRAQQRPDEVMYPHLIPLKNSGNSRERCKLMLATGAVLLAAMLCLIIAFSLMIIGSGIIGPSLLSIVGGVSLVLGGGGSFYMGGRLLFEKGFCMIDSIPRRIAPSENKMCLYGFLKKNGVGFSGEKNQNRNDEQPPSYEEAQQAVDAPAVRQFV